MISLSTEKQEVLNMLVELHNSLRKLEITERLASRANLRGDLNNQQKLALGQMQQQIKHNKDTMQDLLEILPQAKDVSSLAETLKSYYPEK